MRRFAVLLTSLALLTCATTGGLAVGPFVGYKLATNAGRSF